MGVEEVPEGSSQDNTAWEERIVLHFAIYINNKDPSVRTLPVDCGIMSGRSAHVRKKINDPKVTDKGFGLGRGRANSVASGRTSTRDDYGAHERPLSPGTSYGSTNARLLKFSESIREPDFSSYRPEAANFSNQSNDSQSGGSDAGMGDSHTPRYHGSIPDFAYARVRKPVLKTEDMSGIERSGFRSAVDKKSEGVRKGITKAFSFGRKKKKGDGMNPASLSPIGPGPYDDYSLPHDPDEGPAFSGQFANPTPTVMDMEHYYMMSQSQPPLSMLPPNTPPIKRWIGAGRPVQRWNKLRKDPELWDPNGDVLVYFGHKGQNPRPNPSFRLSSHIVEATESRFLITLLREGATDDDDMQISPSPIGAPPMIRHPMSNHLGPSYSHVGQPTPPISDDTSLAEADGQISYEMYFPIPSNMNRIDAHRHAITTRNVFALLYHASLVGFSLYQTLSDLLCRLETYMPQDADNVGTILNYLSARGIDDPRNDPETAVSILAWSETADVRWEEGWMECFVHCAGMYHRLESCTDFKSLTPITKALIERAYLETQLRVQAAEGRLAEFAYDDMWSGSGSISGSPGRAAADRLQKFFVAHYAAVYGAWPPPAAAAPGARAAMGEEGEDMWLTRIVARKLAADFGALYDYLVNRDIIWDESEFRSSRKWMLVSAAGDRSFTADTSDLPLTDMLIEFDNRQRFPHIPHPYPLVPEPVPPHSPRPMTARREKGKKGDRAAPTAINSSTRLQQGRSSDERRNLERRVQLAYAEATNIYRLGPEFAYSSLIDAFVKFEKTDQVGETDPFVARRGRWVLVYGILQTLASVSVDASCVRYLGPDVAYHLSPRLGGRGAGGSASSSSPPTTKIPPWKGARSQKPSDASHEHSHCWIVPSTWRHASDESGKEIELTGPVDISNGRDRQYRTLEYPDDGGSSADTVLGMMRSQAQRFPSPPRTLPRLQARRAANTPLNHQGAAWSPHSPQYSHASGAGSWTTRNVRQSGTAVSVSAQSDDTAATSFSGGNRSRVSGSISGSEKPKSIKGYSNFSYGRSVPPPTTSSPTSIAGDNIDEIEWPVRTYSISREQDSTFALSPPPNRPLPLPVSLTIGSSPTSSISSPPSSSLSAMMAAATRGVIANVDSDAEDSISPPSYPRVRKDGVGTVRELRPLLHRRASSGALGPLIQDFKAMNFIHDD